MNFEPLIDGISRFLRVAGQDSEAGVKGMHAPSDVERWLGGSLSKPEKQLPLIHDYLRGAHALREAETTGVSTVRDIDVPTWQTYQQRLEQQVQVDPEVQKALKDLYVNSKLPADPDVTTHLVSPKPVPTASGAAPAAAPITAPEGPMSPLGGEEVSVEGTLDAPKMPQAKPSRMPPGATAAAALDRSQAWNEFAIATEAQDASRMSAALERIKALHEPETQTTRPGELPNWQKALNYMGGLEQKVAELKAGGTSNDAWSRELMKYKDQSAIDAMPLSKPARDTIERFHAWADSQKPPTVYERFKQALGVPRAVMTSIDLSAPGRQGLLLMSRPEYWQHMSTMVNALGDAGYLESQRYIRNHPDFQKAHDAGLAITDIHNKLAPREEAFRSTMAEKIPGVRASEQAYTTFLNRVRFDTFSNVLREAAAAGIDVHDSKLLNDLAEWINTATGRGGGKGFNPGVLSEILFSPRLAWARFQTLNPLYYIQMHPFVRAQALKTQFASAAMVYGLVSLAGMFGAKVMWDFRSPDAGKVRIGNARLDFGGGVFQFLRLYDQLYTNEKLNADTGVVTKLGAKAFSPSRLDVMTQFIISKEAPIASFVTDWMRGKDQQHKAFNLTDEMISRVVPLGLQDMNDVVRDQGVGALLWAAPAATFGIGLQTYAPATHHETVPFLGVKGQVPDAQAQSYAQSIMDADKKAAVEAMQRSKNLGPMAAKAVLRSYVRVERMKARQEWIKANVQAYQQAKRAGQPTTPLAAPEAQK